MIPNKMKSKRYSQRSQRSFASLAVREKAFHGLFTLLADWSKSREFRPLWDPGSTGKDLPMSPVIPFEMRCGLVIRLPAALRQAIGQLTDFIDFTTMFDFSVDGSTELRGCLGREY